MGTWTVDGKKHPGVLFVKLVGRFTTEEMRAFQALNNATIEAFGNGDYRVLADMRELHPLSPECAEIQMQIKRFSSGRANFCGSAVLVASSVLSLQHRRTAVGAGLSSLELVTDNEAEAWAHLGRVNRSPG